MKVPRMLIIRVMAVLVVFCIDAQAARISNLLKAPIRDRVNAGFNPSIIIGVTDANGRDYYAYGNATLGDGQVPDENTLYEIGSITKVFTTTLLAEMAARGEVELDDPISNYLPDNVNVPSFGQTVITLEHLATHVSGFPTNPPSIINNSPLNPFFPFPESELYDFLNDYDLTRRPGSAFEYSNIGLGLLGFTLAYPSDLTFHQLLRQRVIDPLGLEDTRFELSEEQRLRRATGYSGVVDRPPFKMETLDGAGALVSSASDMLKFLEYQMALRDTDLKDIISDTHQKRTTVSPASDMGLGWWTVNIGGTRVIMHDGATMGHRSFIGFDPVKKLGVVVLTNTRINPSSEIQDIGLRALIPSFPLTPLDRPANVSDTTLQRYHGNFVGEEGDSFKVRIIHGHVTIAYSGDNEADFTLYARSSRRFEMKELGVEGAYATFASNGASMQWTQSGQTALYEREVIEPLIHTQINDGKIHLSVTGDTGYDYIIQRTMDFKAWDNLDTTTIWDEPIELPIPSSEESYFYRVKYSQ